ncbi:MAG TPA: DUF4350 domain-containing protein [Steroidobacteraceae bacterium]|nr:DUF4350 domain-containing protein [Steroidobacteraceae bacterium]
MNERLVTLAYALGALVLFVAMFLRGEGALDRTSALPRPTSAERRDSGHFAALAWLQSEQIRAQSWRERFDRLAGAKLVPAPTGNLLIVTLPTSVRFRTEELLPLGRWVAAGNTLLVLAALADDPDWAAGPSQLAAADLNLLAGLEFEPVRATPGDEPGAPAASQRATLVPNRIHAYFEGVNTGVALAHRPARGWRVHLPYDGFVLALAHDGRTGENVLWTRPMGEGRVIVSGYGTLFNNRVIGQGDNARLFANLVAANVGPQGTVLFDDLHQGLGAAYDPQQFYADRRLYLTVAILAGLWLLWVVGSTRLRTPAIGDSAPSETDLVRAGGNLLARVVRPPAAARALIEHFFARTRRRAALASPADPPWGYLGRHPRVAGADLERLKTWYGEACASRHVPLLELHNLLVRIERQLA